MQVSDYDYWVVRVRGEYLVGIPYEDTVMCRMSNSPYDAAPIKLEFVARDLARRAGGDAVMFNPVTGVVG